MGEEQKTRIPLSITHVPSPRFAPSKETLEVLNTRNWVANYSGGKDSTALVSWVEYLRRAGLVRVDRPRLVQSDTGVEYPFLEQISSEFRARLEQCGWECLVVRPHVRERLYCQIFGRGLTPVHPGNKKVMRWCTRATKIDPMRRISQHTPDTDTVSLSGVRWGESDLRDGKLALGGCVAGGECGLPSPGEGVYGAIISWKMCQVVEWVSGQATEASQIVPDLVAITRQLVEAYDMRTEQENLFGLPRAISTTMRFGCIGCPAISNEKITRSTVGKRNARWQHLRRIYGIWEQLYRRDNRCVRFRNGKWVRGPIKMAVRKRFFAELLKIQEDSGVQLVSSEDIAFIYDCWAKKVYLRGWSEADELVVEPESGLFKGQP
jgi:DNA sulfur modification protein DndC